MSEAPRPSAVRGIAEYQKNWGLRHACADIASAFHMNGTLSEFLNLLDLRGQTWCFVDIRSSGGFSMPAERVRAVLRGPAGIRVHCRRRRAERLNCVPAHVAMILSGEAHAVRTKQPKVQRAPLEFLCTEQNVDVLSTITIGSGAVIARVALRKI